MSRKAVLHYLDGTIRKGFVPDDFDGKKEHVEFQELDRKDVELIELSRLKAIFFVKGFQGRPAYREQKRYGISKRLGKRVYIKFKDGEVMLGYLTSDLPWDKGFFITGNKNRGAGFFIKPVDSNSNNLEIFVVTTALKDLTIM